MITLHNIDVTKGTESFVEDESVDLIFTDPPYSKEYLHLYEWLASEADRVLKPDGFMIAYCGPYHKDKVMNHFGDKLQYFYDFVLVHNGNTSILWPRRIISGYKSLLCYHKKSGSPIPKTNVLGKLNGIAGDKRYHRWGQSEYEAKYYIDCFTSPGDLVVDYFLGGGTVPTVCKKLNRRCIGFDNDNQAFDTSTERVNSEQNGQLEFKQMELI